jgi:predicted flap endonuclease-1-like 5' DNA nuclease
VRTDAALRGRTAGAARRAALALCLSAIVVAGALAARGIEPFATWCYPLLWYPTLAALDLAAAPRAGGFFWLDRPRFAFGLFAWSVVGWCVFEALNFRVRNWYYVFVPDDPVVRWAGVAISYATVFPAIWLAERWLRGHGVAARWTCPRVRVTPGLRRGCAALGVAFLAAAAAWPSLFYPFIWGAVTLLLEPWNYARDPRRSLLGDLERGHPGRVVRLALGGLAVGFLWELYNVPAASRWIYTVPGFETFKLFEMPVPGFLGFAVFAWDVFVMVQWLVLHGVLSPPEREAPARPLRAGRVLPAAALGTAFAALVFLGMERWTIHSVTPRVAAYDLLPADARRGLVAAGFDRLQELWRTPAETLAARVPGAAAQDAAAWRAAARLALLRGIGTETAERLAEVGIRRVEELAAADPAELYERVRAAGGPDARLRPAVVREWVRAARRAVAR